MVSIWCLSVLHPPGGIDNAEVVCYVEAIFPALIMDCLVVSMTSKRGNITYMVYNALMEFTLKFIN